jgi:hypothetical protein
VALQFELRASHLLGRPSYCLSYSTSPISFIEKMIFSTLHILGTFVRNQLTENADYFWALYSVALIYMFVF